MAILMLTIYLNTKVLKPMEIKFVPDLLSYGDVIKRSAYNTDKYYLIIQIGYGELALINLTGLKEWNRSVKPVKVEWNQLTIDRFKELLGWDEEVTLVSSKTTLIVDC